MTLKNEKKNFNYLFLSYKSMNWLQTIMSKERLKIKLFLRKLFESNQTEKFRVKNRKRPK